MRLLKQIIFFATFLLNILSMNEVQAKVSKEDLSQLNNEFKIFIENTGGEKSPYRQMSLPLYALEFDHIDIFFYLAERDGLQHRYVSTLQEPIVTVTTIFHTAIRKKNALLLDTLLTNFQNTDRIYEYSRQNNRVYETVSMMGLALLPEYVNYDVIKVILDHGFDPNGKNKSGSDRYKNLDSRNRPYWSKTTTYQAFMINRLDILELLLTYDAHLDSKLLDEYIMCQNIEGVQLVLNFGVHVFWRHIELALKYDFNPEGNEIVLLLHAAYDQKSE